MDMYQKREMRKTKKMDEKTKSLPSTSINWYPGHMHKTRKEINDIMPSIDIIFESEKLIRKITDDKKYDDVIKVSVYCQNKLGLPNGLNDKMLHFVLSFLFRRRSIGFFSSPDSDPSDVRDSVS